MKVLRDLPGVSDVEAMCRVRSYFDPSNNIDATLGKINKLSISYFCLPHWLTDYDDFKWDADEVRPSRRHWDVLLDNG